jgi:hypothetical protein
MGIYEGLKTVTRFKLDRKDNVEMTSPKRMSRKLLNTLEPPPNLTIKSTISHITILQTSTETIKENLWV